MATKNIVVVGASFAGLLTAHYWLRRLSKATTEGYSLVLIDQSSHFWSKIAAPRAMVTEESVPDKERFLSLRGALAQYEPHLWSLQQARVTGVDFEERTVTTRTSAGTTETIPFHALIIASGTSTPTPLTSLHGEHSTSIDALTDMRQRLAKRPSSIVIAGGGPVGVETAGEIGEALNGAAAGGSADGAATKCKITLLAGDRQLLPLLKPKFGAKADALLQRVGVDVKYGRNSRVARVSAEGAQTRVHLSDGQSIDCDIYIPATGATPNTGFLPAAVLDERKYVRTSDSLRVPGAGDRVYCVGDVGSYSKGGLPLIQTAVPILVHNLLGDLRVDGYAKPQTFKDTFGESQLVPVGRTRGLGSFKGFSVPSFVVMKLLKGKDYMQKIMLDVYTGQQWGKPLEPHVVPTAATA